MNRHHVAVISCVLVLVAACGETDPGSPAPVVEVAPDSPAVAAPSFTAPPADVEPAEQVDSSSRFDDVMEVLALSTEAPVDPLLLDIDPSLLATVLADRCDPATLDPDEHVACLLDSTGFVDDLIDAATDDN